MPASCALAGSYTSWHAHDELLDQPARYRTPALLQGLTKSIPLLFGPAEVVEFRVAPMEKLLKVPPHVLDRVKVW